MPAAPSVTSITFDHPSYTAGALITATVTYVKGKSDSTDAVTGTVTDPVTGLTGQLAGSIVFPSAVTDTTNPSVADDGGRTWVKVSDSGTVAVFTATA